MIKYLIFVASLREELNNIGKMITIAERSVAGIVKHPEDSDIYINSAALNLHSFYAGLEKMFMSIAEKLDQSVPSSGSWHLELLKQMTLDLPSIRPPVITKRTKTLLDDYRSFRHVVRNVYTYNLDAKRVTELVDNLPTVFAAITADLNQFFTFLDAAAQTPINDD